MALSRANRLPLRLERDRLNHEGKTHHTKYFTIIVASFKPNPRFAILLSKKTAKLAVDRNKIKRLTSAAIIDLLPSFPPADYLLIPKSTVLDASVLELKSDIKHFLDQ